MRYVDDVLPDVGGEFQARDDNYLALSRIDTNRRENRLGLQFELLYGHRESANSREAADCGKFLQLPVSCKIECSVD